MNTPLIGRRQLLAAGAGAVLTDAVGAQPAKAVHRLFVGFPPGQATDSVARILAEKMHQHNGDNYVVENRPGAGGSMAMAQLAKSPNDGSVMMLTHMSAVATNPHMYRNPGYDSIKDFAAVGLAGDLPFVLAVNPSLPVKSVAELIKYAKANPGKLSNSSSGNGTVSHLAMEEFKRRAGIEVLHVPYKGSSPGLNDVMAGRVSMALETAAAVQPLLEGGRLRVLAVGSQQRLQGPYAGIPTLAEEGFKDFNAVTWLMLIYPAGTPKPAIQQTFTSLNTVLRQPDTQKQMLAIGALPRMSKSPEEADAYIRSEYKYWGEVVARSGVTLD